MLFISTFKADGNLTEYVCKVFFEHILADNWFGSKANMAYIHNDLQKSFIIGIKSNRTLALSKNDANNGRYTKVRDLELDEDIVYTVWLKGLNFPVRLLKKIFKNENETIDRRRDYITLK